MDERFATQSLDPPVFVLGIWRSGTTHLQNLFAVDERFAFPNWYQVTYPHSFLGTEAKRSRFLGFFIPETRFQDNMKYGLAFPAEDEFAICTISARSVMMSWIFPRRAEHYARYGTLGEVPEAEVAEWKAGAPRVRQEACLEVSQARRPQVPLPYRANPAPPRRLPRGEVRSHPPRSLCRFPILLSYDARGDEVLHLAAAQPRCGGMGDSPISRGRGRLPRGEGPDSGGAIPRASLRGPGTRPRRPDANDLRSARTSRLRRGRARRSGGTWPRWGVIRRMSTPRWLRRRRSDFGTSGNAPSRRGDILPESVETGMTPGFLK